MKRAAILALGLSAMTASAADVYSSEASFVSQLAPGYYLEEFDTFSGGGAWDAPGASGYDFTAEATFGLFVTGGMPAAPAISVSSPDDTLLFTFTGAPVTALGAFFSTRSLGGNDQMNVITLSDGTVETFIGTDFRGFTSSVPIASFTFFGSDDPSYTRQWLDHLYVGSAVPEPTSAALLLLAGGLCLRRR